MSHDTKKLQTELNNFKALQKQYQKTVSARRLLGSQLHENTTVQEELQLLKDGQEVFKLIGPILVKQDKTEAKQNVGKRMDYINGELKRVDDSIAELEKKLDKQKEILSKLQQESVMQLQQESVMPLQKESVMQLNKS